MLRGSLEGLRNFDLTEGKYQGSKALIAFNSSKVVHLVKSFYVTLDSESTGFLVRLSISEIIDH